MSALVRPWPGISLVVRTGFPCTDGGKSHSCVTPTSASESPSAHTISVALGRSETILTGRSPRPSPCRLGMEHMRQGPQALHDPRPRLVEEGFVDRVDVALADRGQ